MLDRADITGVLMQIRAAQQNMPQTVAPLRMPSAEAAEEQLPVREVPPFSSLLKQAIDAVNGHQQQANDLRTRYELGDPDVDLVNVMIAAQKASVSFEAMFQVRNRLVSSYQEIMRMSI